MHGHDLGAAHEAVQGKLVDQEQHRHLPREEPFLVAHPPGQARGDYLAGHVRVDRQQGMRVVLGLQRSGDDRRAPVPQR